MPDQVMKPRKSVGNGTHLAGCLGASIVASLSRKASMKREFAIVERAVHLYNIDILVSARLTGIRDIVL